MIFNYLFSNGDAHLKNFSIIETSRGDFKLAPAYDLLNTRLHTRDSDFALEDNLLPQSRAQGTVQKQFYTLSELAGIENKQADKIFKIMLSESKKIEELIERSYLSAKFKRRYLQNYQRRLKKLGG